MTTMVAPTAVNSKVQLPALSPEQQGALIKAKQYAMQESVKHVLKKQQLQAGITASSSGNMTQAMQLQRQQALVLMCRVYVGSIFYDLKEEVVRQAFNPFGIIKQINMSFDPITGKHKGFAFIEYETADAAQLAMEQMSGVLMAGRPIKVGRPSNMPQSHPIIDQILEESKTTKRIYVSNIHEDLNVDDLKSVFSAFGAIKKCLLAPDITTGKHKGYGSIEYETTQSARDAISSMNLFDLGGEKLRVGRGIGPPPHTYPGNSFSNTLTGPPLMSAPAQPPISTPIPTLMMQPTVPFTAIAPTSSIPQPSVAIPPPGLVIPPVGIAIPPPRVVVPTAVGMSSQNSLSTSHFLPTLTPDMNSLSTEEDVKVSGTGARHMLMHKLMRSSVSRIMKLCNMVDADEIDEDLESEVTEECGKFGSVAKVIIYQEKQGEEEDATCIVKIFVEFEAQDSAKKAVEGLNGRWFGGRQIQASFFPEAKYAIGDYGDT